MWSPLRSSASPCPPCPRPSWPWRTRSSPRRPCLTQTLQKSCRSFNFLCALSSKKCFLSKRVESGWRLPYPEPTLGKKPDLDLDPFLKKIESGRVQIRNLAHLIWIINFYKGFESGSCCFARIRYLKCLASVFQRDASELRLYTRAWIMLKSVGFRIRIRMISKRIQHRKCHCI